MLEPEDALPWALAAYATARAQEIQTLQWPDVDLDDGLLLLAGDDDARKSDAARRLIPVVGQLREHFRAEWSRQGRPTSGRVCPPRRRSRSGLLSLNQLQKRVFRIWGDSHPDTAPITLRRYTHGLAGELDRARDQLDEFLAGREADEEEEPSTFARRPPDGHGPDRPGCPATPGEGAIDGGAPTSPRAGTRPGGPRWTDTMRCIVAS